MRHLPVALWLLCVLPPAQAGPWETNRALVSAVDAGSLAQIRRLIAQGADVNAVNDYGNPALEQAVQAGNSDAAKLLLDAGADVNHGSRRGTPLVVAAEGDYGDKSVALCRLLLAHGADPNGQPNRTPLVSSLRGLASVSNGIRRPLGPVGRLGVVQVMLQKRTETTLAILRLLIRSGANVNHKDNMGHLSDRTTPLTAAARAGSVEAMKLLLASGARDAPDYDLEEAATSGSVPAVAFLLSRGANPNGWRSAFNHNTALLNAVEADAPDCLRLLVNAGADVNVPNEEGRTPLAILVARTKPDIPLLKFLLAHGADPDVPDKEGHRPLDWMKQPRDAKLIALLQHAGAKK